MYHVCLETVHDLGWVNLELNPHVSSVLPIMISSLPFQLDRGRPFDIISFAIPQ